MHCHQKLLWNIIVKPDVEGHLIKAKISHNSLHADMKKSQSTDHTKFLRRLVCIILSATIYTHERKNVLEPS